MQYFIMRHSYHDGDGIDSQQHHLYFASMLTCVHLSQETQFVFKVYTQYVISNALGRVSIKSNVCENIYVHINFPPECYFLMEIC